VGEIKRERETCDVSRFSGSLLLSSLVSIMYRRPSGLCVEDKFALAIYKSSGGAVEEEDERFFSFSPSSSQFVSLTWPSLVRCFSDIFSCSQILCPISYYRLTAASSSSSLPVIFSLFGFLLVSLSFFACGCVCCVYFGCDRLSGQRGRGRYDKLAYGDFEPISTVLSPFFPPHTIIHLSLPILFAISF
jgi:hypothetical protein